MNQYNFIQSSIGQKVVMATTGIFLMSFLLIHLSVNLFLFYGEEAFNNAVFFMRKNIFIRILEYVLALGFIVHILFGIKLHLKNEKSKGKVDYSLKKSFITFSSRTMIYTGFLILCFLILHLMNFTIPMKYNNSSANSDYIIVITLFKNPLYTLIYVFSFLVLGIHLNHGFQSSFQSLGFYKKNKFFWIKKLGFFYFLFVCSGFSIIAIWFFFNSN
ncbi:succinate dehydrogenase cytochrome b subunit [Blattabacterium punctulatus CPU2]|uniref:Succinate dehydrogenase cytochrome b subunit n=1 Tax=Blattabacterium punctulatus CPU2 TaxID=1457032 RepID=A0AAD1CMC9_9FLAO|nr:succinate dehydrogenase cytochrome b subunit [Blattabacterium punctulatus]AWU39173.1 succinate dehydrogenase [Blattabacterium punctulatus]BBA17945.1 succinate dehydrogenase cytochrome b subunit [Blattabacterium punctulatus CPU2]